MPAPALTYINYRAKLKVPTKLLISLAILFFLDSFVRSGRSKFGEADIKTAQTEIGRRRTMARIRNKPLPLDEAVCAL
jgi:hypothetical protein